MRVAVLGLGSAGRRHAGHALGLGHEVVAWDPVAPAPDGVRAVDSPEAAIAAADAVVVASPNVHHPTQALAAIAAGRPVLVEKPLALDAAGAAQVRDAAAAAGVVAGVAMNLRFLPVIAALRDAIAAGELGRVLHVRATFGFDLRLWRPGTDWRASYSARADLGGGILLDAIHELDYVGWMLGPATSVAAELARVGDLGVDVEDTADLLVRHASGARSAIHLDFVAPAYDRGADVVGTEATASWSWGGDVVTVRRHDTPDRAIAAPGDVATTYRAVIADFLDAVASGGAPRTTLAEGVEALRLADAARASSRGGVRVEL